ncbi:MAG TPA: hypothetical protein VK636_10465 [Gemmatimonadaceae bacterium]|nr:hypothetical protein [Gemmatimonadaceae bacterium]
MADRDWDKELAKVDKQLASLSDEALLGPPQVPAARGQAGGGKAPAPAAGKAAAKSAPSSGERTTKAWAVYARLTLSVALGVAMVLWPYPARCGIGLAGYLAAVVVVVASGVWSSVWTWRHRAAHAHTLSLLIVLWGLILGSMEVLPRVGYAKPDLQHPTAWACP